LRPTLSFPVSLEQILKGRRCPGRARRPEGEDNSLDGLQILSRCSTVGLWLEVYPRRTWGMLGENLTHMVSRTIRKRFSKTETGRSCCTQHRWRRNALAKALWLTTLDFVSLERAYVNNVLSRPGLEIRCKCMDSIMNRYYTLICKFSTACSLQDTSPSPSCGADLF